jgi:hypothetical protein
MSSLVNEKSKKSNAEVVADLYDKVYRFGNYVGVLVQELWHGYKDKRIPYGPCLLFSGALELLLFFDYDRKFFGIFFIPNFLVVSQYIFLPFFVLTVFSGFIGWAYLQNARSRYLNEEINRVFRGIKLRNGWKETPRFIFDHSVDEDNRHLKLSKELLSEDQFKSKTEEIGQALKIYIENIEEVREDGTIDIFYSTKGMAKLFECVDYSKYRNFSFLVGKGRSKEIVSSLIESPHLLVAGESGGGKSSFLRHLLTTLYLNNKSAEFLFVDLKDNLEGQTFEGLDRMTVSNDPGDAIQKLIEIRENMTTRSTALRTAKAKDLDEYIKMRNEKRKLDPESLDQLPHLPRHIIAVDEAANLYLVNKRNTTADVLDAREVISKIARTGRALGFHLIFGIQRPDSIGIESQVKANLSQILAFKAANNASSMTILDNVRAAQLPKIPGRAIWKVGGEIAEIQTPFLDKPKTQEILGISPKEIENPEKSVPQMNSRVVQRFDFRYKKEIDGSEKEN